MKYVEFYDNRGPRPRKIGEIKMERGKLVMSEGDGRALEPGSNLPDIGLWRL